MSTSSDPHTRAQEPDEAYARPDIPVDEQRAIVRRLLELEAEKNTERAASIMRVTDCEEYTSEQRFRDELRAVFAAWPMALCPAAHVSRPGDTLAMECLGVPVLVLRDRAGRLRAFLNACRHRGSRLVAPGQGRCKGSITCGYHAWRYSDDGALEHVPREERFGAVERESHGLVPLPVVERHAQIWIAVEPHPGADACAHIDDHLAPLADSLAGYEMPRSRLMFSHRKRWRMNWKLAVESALENHHVSVLHRETIAPLFAVDLMLHQARGDHIRVCFPKRGLPALAGQDPSTWQLRDQVNAVYYLPPNAMLLVDSRFIMQFQLFPESPGQSLLHSHMLVHESDLERHSEARWRAAFDATMEALDEDYEMAETIQANIAAGAHRTRTFGRNEAALQHFHAWLAGRLALHAGGAPHTG